MTDNEKLIEETAKAIMEASHGDGEWEFREPIEEELYLRRARAALAVFEKAHTPTDDVREALACIVRDETGEAEEEAGFVVDAILAAGFRRSEVPEPSAEMIAPEDGMTLEELGEAVSNWSPAWDGDEAMHSLIYRFIEHYAALDGEVYAAREDVDFEPGAEILFRYDDEMGTLVRVPTEPQGEPSDRIPWETAEGVVTAVDLDGTVRRAHPEPSDAQVEAAARSWVTNGGVATWDNAAPHVRDNAIRRMREALRAAGGVR